MWSPYLGLIQSVPHPITPKEMSQGDSRECASVGEAETGARGVAGPSSLLSDLFLSPGLTSTVSPNKQSSCSSTGWYTQPGPLVTYKPLVTMGSDGLEMLSLYW